MSAFFTTLLGSGRDPQATEGKLGLPLNDDDAESSHKLALSEKSEFRIEGMTCGACVEVRGPFRLFCFIETDRST